MGRATPTRRTCLSHALDRAKTKSTGFSPINFSCSSWKIEKQRDDYDATAAWPTKIHLLYGEKKEGYLLCSLLYKFKWISIINFTNFCHSTRVLQVRGPLGSLDPLQMPPVCLCVNVLLLTTSLFGRQRLRVSVASFDVACLQRRQQHGNIATATSTTTLQDTLGKNINSIAP